MSDAPIGAPAPTAAPADSAPAETIESNEVELGTEETAPVETAPKQEPKSNKKKLQLKVDGQDIEEEIDLDNEEELKKAYQLSKVAQKRMQETAELKKQLGEFFALMNDNPAEALSQLGLNPDDFAEKHLSRKVEDMKKSPEVLAKEKLESELNKLKKEMEKREKAAQDAQMQAIQEQYHIELDRDITSAISESNDLPKSPYVVKRIADMMMARINAGDLNIKAKDVVPVVRKQIKKELQEMFGVMPEEMLETAIGRENIERLRKKRIAAAKKAKIETAKSIQDTGTKKASNESESEKKSKIPMSKFFKNL